jgi:hypothetical protein
MQDMTVERASGAFTPKFQSLLVDGTWNGAPTIEDFRFIHSGNAFYVLRDIYINGTSADLVTGRSAPVMLEETSTRESGARSRGAQSQAYALAAAPPAVPKITIIHGLNDDANTGIVDGLVHMTCGAAYNTGRVVNGSAPQFQLSMPFYWDVYGSNFGSAKGTIQLAGINVPASAITAWTPTYIRFYPSVPYNWGAISTTFSITNTSGGTLKSGAQIVPSISGRIEGQCTWFVALARINGGKAPSPDAYPPGAGWSTITAAYVPQRLDQLVYQWTNSKGVREKHTAIINSVSQPVKSGNTTTWTVVIGEANALCDNQISSKQSTFQLQNGTITKFIQSSAGSTLAPGWFYR